MKNSCVIYKTGPDTSSTRCVDRTKTCLVEHVVPHNGGEALPVLVASEPRKPLNHERHEVVRRRQLATSRVSDVCITALTLTPASAASLQKLGSDKCPVFSGSSSWKICRNVHQCEDAAARTCSSCSASPAMVNRACEQQKHIKNRSTTRCSHDPSTLPALFEQYCDGLQALF